MTHHKPLLAALLCTTAALATACGTAHHTTNPTTTTQPHQQTVDSRLITFRWQYKTAIAPTTTIAKHITTTLQQATHPHPTRWLAHHFNTLSHQLAKSNHRLTRLHPPPTITHTYHQYLTALYRVQHDLATIATNASHNNIPKVRQSAAHLVHAISLTTTPNTTLNQRLGLTHR